MRYARCLPHKFYLLSISTLLLIVLSGTGSHASEWLSTNGPYGGDVVSLSTDAAGRVYAARSDNIFRSDDGGATWINLSKGNVRANILCLDVADNGNIYAGVFSRGVYWSYDGGATWDYDQITNNPHNGLGATIIAVGVNADGVIFAGSFRSLNNGSTWLDLDFYGYSWAFDSAANVYAGSREGVRYSTDDGASWTMLNAGMEDEDVEALALNSQEHLFAGTRDSGVYRSTDGGMTWETVNSGLPSLRVRSIAVDTADRVYLVLEYGGLYISTDSGSTWSAIEAGLPDNTILGLETTDDGAVFAGSRYHGVFRSDDQGTTWISQANDEMCLPHLRDLTVARPTGNLYVAADGGGIYRSTNSGIDWEMANEGLSTTRAYAVASDPNGKLYVGTEDGVYASTDAGSTWSPANSGHEGIPARGLLIDGEDVIAVLSTFELGFEFSVLRSTDGGASWQEILNDLDATLPTTAEAWAIDYNGRLFIGGMSMATESVIFVSDDGGTTWDENVIQATGTTGLAVDFNGDIYAPMGNNDLYKSTDHGVSWVEIPNGGWPTGTVGVLDVVGVDASNAVLLSSRNAGIWRSTDGGNTWDLHDDGLPTDHYPSLTFIETAGGANYAGTSAHGLFRMEGTTNSVDPVAVAVYGTNVSISPSPFSSLTRIRYELAENAPVRVTIHDVAGRLVRTLINGERQEPGIREAVWDGRTDTRTAAPPGVYFARIQAADTRMIGKTVVSR